MKIIGQLKAVLGLDKTKYDRGFNQAEQRANRFSAGIKRLAGIMAAAFSVTMIAGFIKSITLLSAKAEGVKTAFQKLAEPGLLNDLRRATRNTVTDLQLMQKAIQARNFKIPLGQLATYFEFATKRAIQTGESVDYLVDSIITGIGRKSVLVMDNLGISAAELQKEIEKVGDFGIASGNIIRRELESMGSVADTTATQIDQIKTSWENFKLSFGDSAFMGKVKTLLDWFGDMQDIFSDPNLTGWQKFRMTPEKYTQYKKEKGYINFDMYSGGESSGGPLEKIKKQEKTIADLRIELENYKKAVDSTLVSDQARRIELLLQIKATEDLIKKLTTLNDEIVRTAGVNKINIDTKSISGVGINLPGLQAGPSDVKVKDLTEALEDQRLAVDILASAFDALFSSTEDGFKAMIDSIITSLKRLIAEIMAKVVVLTILNALSGGGASFANILGTATGLGSIAKGASGGTIPPGYPNDTYPLLASSGETLLTENQSRNFNRMIEVHVTGDILGRGIAISGRRMETDN